MHISLKSRPSVARKYIFIIQHGLIVSMLTLAWGRASEREAEEETNAGRQERSSKRWHKVKKVQKQKAKVGGADHIFKQ